MGKATPPGEIAVPRGMREGSRPEQWEGFSGPKEEDIWGAERFFPSPLQQPRKPWVF